jgi:hypothetical protein
MIRARRGGWAALLAVIATSGVASAVPLDRAVVRFVALETGGMASPRFVFERELAFEARLEALADRTFELGAEEPYREQHVRSALERHLAETLLESLAIDPEPSADELAARVEAVKLGVFTRVGGPQAFRAAAVAEGISPLEQIRLFRRQARASLYLDRMVAPMLDPSEAELRQVHRVSRTPFSGKPFSEVSDELRRWYVAGELDLALEAFYEGARSRLLISILH